MDEPKYFFVHSTQDKMKMRKILDIFFMKSKGLGLDLRHRKTSKAISFLTDWREISYTSNEFFSSCGFD